MEFSDQRAIYLQIAKLVEDKILSGEWAEGERVPSVREFGVQYGVNPATVLRGYDELADTGVLQQRRGIGYYVLEGARGVIRVARQQEFFSATLPQLFEEIDALGITFEQLSAAYSARKG